MILVSRIGGTFHLFQSLLFPALGLFYFFESLQAPFGHDVKSGWSQMVAVHTSHYAANARSGRVPKTGDFNADALRTCRIQASDDQSGSGEI